MIILKPKAKHTYFCLIKASRRPKNNSYLFFKEGLKAKVIDFNNGVYSLFFSGFNDFDILLKKIGKMPLPPYIKRDAKEEDTKNYQTVYAKEKGSIAAPTAGLHFSKELLKKIKKKGVQIAEITLHIAYGTFLPVKSADIRDHKMHFEHFFISDKTKEKIALAKKRKKKNYCLRNNKSKNFRICGRHKWYS